MIRFSLTFEPSCGVWSMMLPGIAPETYIESIISHFKLYRANNGTASSINIFSILGTFMACPWRVYLLSPNNRVANSINATRDISKRVLMMR